MEQIKIIAFIISSFFGNENNRIAADKTTVTVYPKEQKIEIIQVGLFTIAQTEKDSTLALAEWNQLLRKGKVNWSEELDNFTNKTFTPTLNIDSIQPQVILNYSNETDLRSLGIWYDKTKNEFSTNNIPQQNITTNDGTLINNYWKFDGSSKFSFTIEPFLQIPEKYLKSKISIQEILKR